MSEIGTDWRMIDGVATAWFGAPSMRVGAVLAGRVIELTAELTAGTAVDLRSTGIRVRLDADEHVAAVSAAAHELGLVADPVVLQGLGLVFDTTDPDVVRPFWQGVLGYAPADDGGLADPLRRDPPVRFRPSTESRPLRNRVHVDVVRPAATVELTSPGEASGPYGVRHVDPDGNEIDLVPGDPLGEDAGTADWQAVFAAMACYRTTSPGQQRALVAAAAALSDDSGFPLVVDLRPGIVIVDSGKDQWEAEAHGLPLDFIDLAARIQTIAREMGATADTGLPRFVQVLFDAADVTSVTAFWIAALGYVRDRRGEVTDIHDPRRLGPPVVFQPLDPSETERRTQRNRVAVELAVPSELASSRVATAVAAGGSLLDESGGRWRIADPEGNELVVIAGSGGEENGLLDDRTTSYDLDDTAERFRRVAAGLTATIDAVPADAWTNASPCDGWNARDVVAHLVDWIPGPGFMLGTFGIETGPVPPVDSDPAGAWAAVRDAIQGGLDDAAVAQRVEDCGPLGAMTFADAVDMTCTSDVFVHTWDLARAAGIDPDLDQHEIARQYEALTSTSPDTDDAMRASGHFGHRIQVPTGAPLLDHVLAFYGRTVEP